MAAKSSGLAGRRPAALAEPGASEDAAEDEDAAEPEDAAESEDAAEADDAAESAAPRRRRRRERPRDAPPPRPSSPRMRNLRYSPGCMRPSSHTTIEATVSLPWIVEMSKHSTRRGGAASPSTRCSSTRAACCARASSPNRDS